MVLFVFGIVIGLLAGSYFQSREIRLNEDRECEKRALARNLINDILNADPDSIGAICQYYSGMIDSIENDEKLES